jgi:hypothetical protein
MHKNPNNHSDSAIFVCAIGIVHSTAERREPLYKYREEGTADNMWTVLYVIITVVDYI